MTHFSTEFPQKNMSDAAFINLTVGWLQGTTYSTLFNDPRNEDLDVSAPSVRSHDGEELRFSTLGEQGDSGAIGFRHDFPDGDGRLWRTESVLRRKVGEGGQDLIRVRTQCIARVTGARLDTPRKPYLLKMLLASGWGGLDRNTAVSDQPIWLYDDDEGLALGQEVTRGGASHHLPSIYVSAIRSAEWLLSRQQIEKLAYDLGGVAHVFVEPDRRFSFRLKSITAGRNAYGGTIGVVLPGRGLIRRFFMGDEYEEPRDLQSALTSYVLSLRSQMPADGWDWTDLQEQALRQQRQRERNRLSAAEVERLYEDEIAILKDQVTQLRDQKDQIARNNIAAGSDVEQDAMLPSIARHVGPELYPGEVMDRLRLAAKMALAHAEQDGLDTRSRAILDRFVAVSSSDGLAELLQDIRRATSDSRRMADELSDVLILHGYTAKPRNKHVVLEPREGFGGIEPLTVPTTPGDVRSLQNVRKQVERALGITKLRA